MRLHRLLLAAALASFALAPLAHGAELRLVQDPGTRNVAVVLDTQGAAINAIEGTVEVRGGASAVTLGASIIPLWVVRPSATELRFAGVIPGGYVGTAGELFSLQPAGSGQVTLTPREVRAYLNDGAGTAASIIAVPLMAQLPESGGAQLVSSDTDIPDFSEIRVARDPALFDGRWFVAFNAQDATTGVSRYEIAERPGNDVGNLDELEWRPAQSPAPLEDQSRRSTVFVRALDGAGNARVEHVAPAAAQGANPYAVLGGGALLLLLLAAVVVFKRARLKP